MKYLNINIFKKKSPSRHVTTKCTIGCMQSTPTFYHPDLLALFRCGSPLPFKRKWFMHFSNDDPGWIRNSPLTIELVDLLNDALKAIGGWPRIPIPGCGGHCSNDGWVSPQMIEVFNKVCKKFNDAKLFDMGLQCRAGIYTIKDWYAERAGPVFCVLVEKKSDEKLRDVGETLQHLDALKKCVPTNVQRDLEKMRNFKNVHSLPRQLAQAALTWSPPEDWMTRLTPPYNETTNHV